MPALYGIRFYTRAEPHSLEERGLRAEEEEKGEGFDSIAMSSGRTVKGQHLTHPGFVKGPPQNYP